MNKVVERLMNNLFIRRSWITSLNYTTSQSCLYFLRDVGQLANNCESNKKRLNSANINNDLNKLIKYIQKYHRTMNLHEVISTMGMLQEFYNTKQLDGRNLTEIKEFEYMCEIILKNARSLSTYDTIGILNTLLSINISPDTVIIHTLIKLLSASINKLTVRQIILLYGILGNIQHVLIVKGLMKALPQVFKEQAKFEISLTNINMAYMLRFCCTIKDTQTINYIIKLLDTSNRRINPTYVVDILHAICALPELNSTCKSVLSKVYKEINNQTEHFTFKEIETLLHYISVKCENSKMDFYDQTVVNMLCSAVLNYKPSFARIVLIIKHLNKMRYSDINLLKYLLQKCLEDKNVLNVIEGRQINHLVTALVIANYKPYDWEILKEILLKYFCGTSVELSLCEAASVGFCLLSVDYYCPEFFNEVFRLYNSLNYIENKKVTLIMLKLHWCLKLFCPQYQGAMLDESKLNQIIIEHKSNNMPDLRESLEEAVGRSKYVKSDLITKIGESVDYAIVMQQDGSFLNIKNYNISFAEELDSFLECDKFLFFGYPKEAYCTNTEKLLPTIKMLLKAIESLTGFYIFVINPFLWKDFSSEQRIEHLKKGIKLKCSNIPDN